MVSKPLPIPLLLVCNLLIIKHTLVSATNVKIQRMNEIKVVYQGQDMEPYEKIATAYECFCSLQPCDVNDEIKNENNLTAAIGYIKSHPRWRLSLQTHKIINIR